MQLDRGQLDVMVAIVKPPASDPGLRQMPRSFRDNNGGVVTIEVSTWAGHDPKRASQHTSQSQTAPQQQSAPQHRATVPVASTQAAQQQVAAAAPARHLSEAATAATATISTVLPARATTCTIATPAAHVPDRPAPQRDSASDAAHHQQSTPQQLQLAALAAPAQAPRAPASLVVPAPQPQEQGRLAATPAQQQLAVEPAMQLACCPQQQPQPSGQQQLASSSQPAPFTETEQASWEQSEEWLQEELGYPRRGTSHQRQQQRKRLIADIKAMLTQREHRQQLLQPFGVLRPYLVMLCERSQHRWPHCIQNQQLSKQTWLGCWAPTSDMEAMLKMT